MTTGAAENTAGRAGDKEKVEKRRALGRGLESLLPGPRVVAGGAPGQSSGAAGKQQVPHFVRNDKTSLSDRPVSNGADDKHRGESFSGVIRAVAEDAVSESPQAGAPAPHGTAELGAAGSASTTPAFTASDSPAQ